MSEEAAASTPPPIVPLAVMVRDAQVVSTWSQVAQRAMSDDGQTYWGQATNSNWPVPLPAPGNPWFGSTSDPRMEHID